MKKTLFCILLVAVMLFLAACQNPLVYMRKPCNQPNTVWQSEDGCITFTVSDRTIGGPQELLHWMGKMSNST